MPRLVRFITALGVPSVPEHGAPVPPAWPDDAWARSLSSGPYGDPRLADVVPPAAHATFEEWSDATRRHQADAVQLGIEDLRRVKGRPAAGFCHFCLNDGEPAVSCAVIDHARAPCTS
ncbi:MAG: hypothetical protein JOZ99_09710 [Actinobacteria bacterium]|nr:hypothetical protein [Actinomycetota bacterium]